MVAFDLFSLLSGCENIKFATTMQNHQKRIGNKRGENKKLVQLDEKHTALVKQKKMNCKKIAIMV